MNSTPAAGSFRVRKVLGQPDQATVTAVGRVVGRLELGMILRNEAGQTLRVVGLPVRSRGQVERGEVTVQLEGAGQVEADTLLRAVSDP
jgi:hypothetical protein